MSWRTLATLAACSVIVACGGPRPSAAGEASEDPRSASRPALRATVDGALLVVESGGDTGVGITAERRDGTVCCETQDRDAPPIGWIVYEREGERRGYGVYGLGLAKNPMQVPLPLAGDSITWPDKDHAQGLAHLLGRLVPAGEGAALVQRHGERWFRPGLRVFFVMPGPPPDAATTPGGERTTAALRIAELAR